MTKHFRPYFNCPKHSEGGITHKDAKQAAKDLGIEVKIGGSSYVGMFCVFVRTENKQLLARLEQALS